MPSNKRSVYLTNQTLAAIGLPVDADDRQGWSLSGRLNAVVERYSQIVADAMPEFSRGEWCAIFDANNGTIFDEWSLMMIWANVADSPELAEKWKVNVGKLVEKLRGLSKAQAAAVTEAIERFWHHSELETDEAIAKAGVRVAPAKRR